MRADGDRDDRHTPVHGCEHDSPRIAILVVARQRIDERDTELAAGADHKSLAALPGNLDPRRNLSLDTANGGYFRSVARPENLDADRLAVDHHVEPRAPRDPA